ncbi:MAG: zf-HC2 domain-containing protein [Desulfomonile tiedjei]|uniref:Zf-HC2 domain-containing protein n=1 Tax=Desulfomonile tiedjei TaxID=2358 RepID=A0A9D6Z2D7_9BACT|nr:zf-HC2 domain-containing protein [Desulfomonile tiedjei]
MKCAEYKKQISLMIDGELDARSSEALSDHLAFCSDCRRFRERLNAVNVALIKASPTINGSVLAERVKDGLYHRKNRRLQSDFPAWGRVPVVAMLVLLAIGLGNMAGRSISELFINGETAASIELIAPDSGNSFSDVLLGLGTEENQQ